MAVICASAFKHCMFLDFSSLRMSLCLHAFRAELEAQMRATKDARRRQKQAELEEDRRMLSALRVSGNRTNTHVHRSFSPTGHSPPPAPQPTAFCPDPEYGGHTGDAAGGITQMPAAFSALGDTSPNAQTMTGFPGVPGGSQEDRHGNRGGAAGRTGGAEAGQSGLGMPGAAAAPVVAAAKGGVVPRGVLVNMESTLGETPTLHFKSDKAFLTPAEMAARAAAATTLQQALQEQIAEKNRRKDAEKRAEKERDQAEMVRPVACLLLVVCFPGAGR